MNKILITRWILILIIGNLFYAAADVTKAQDKKKQDYLSHLSERFSKLQTYDKVLSFENADNKTLKMEYVNFFNYESMTIGIIFSWNDEENNTTLYAFNYDGQHWTALGSIPYIDVDAVKTMKFFIGNHVGFSLATMSQLIPDAYLLDKNKNEFYKVDLSQMGAITKIPSSDSLIFGHKYCGCAGTCWISRLAKFEEKKFKMIATQGCDCKNYYVMKGDNFDAGPFLEKKSSCTDHSFLGVNLSNSWEEMIKKYQLK